MAKTVAIRLQRDIEELLASRKPLAGKRPVVSAFYHLRPLAEGTEPLMFLFHATKRSIPKSHDRNKQKRRMREAIRKLAVFEALHEQLRSSSRQALVLLRTTRRPSKASSWEAILGDMEAIGTQLQKVTSRNA